MLVQVSRRGVHKDLRLPGTVGDRLETDQKHAIQVHKTLADFPLPGRGFADGVLSLLRFGCEECQTRNFNHANLQPSNLNTV